MLRLYDARTGETGPLKPTGRGLLRLYQHEQAAGPPADLGGWRDYVLADLIRRVAEQRRLTVMACRGLADASQGPAGDHQPDQAAPVQAAPVQSAPVQSAPVQAAPDQSGQDQDRARADATALNLRPADDVTRAQDVIPQIVELLTRLIDGGRARADGGGVWFLAKPDPDDQPPDGDPAGDWPLWRPAPDPAWASPWGPGQPTGAAQFAVLATRGFGPAIDIALGLDGREQAGARAVLNAAGGREVVARWVTAGPAQPGPDTGPGGLTLASLTSRGLDPLAARLEFLSHGYRDGLELTWAGLSLADANLRRWRRQVAQWAASPSQPADAGTLTRLTAALDEDLDTPAALAELGTLAADDQVGPGAKFETFARADQILALDLVADVGRY
jgi:cysteinyl-tRNA synthetase